MYLKVNQEAITARAVTVFVECHPSDYGQLIGEKARHIRAFQCVIHRMGRLRDQKANLSIKQPPDEQIKSPKPNLYRDSDWDKDNEFKRIAQLVLNETMDQNFDLKYFKRGINSYVVIHTKKEMDQDLLESLRSLFQAWAKVKGGVAQIESEIERA